MTTTSDFDRIARGWLAEGPTELSDRVLQSALDEVHATQQRRALRSPWRPPMPTFARAAALGVAAVVVILAGALVIGTGRPFASPSASPAPTAASVQATPTAPGATGTALLAPMGYTGAGTIEFTKHDASGGDVLYLVDPSGANLTKVLDGACCGLFSPDGGQLAVSAKGVFGDSSLQQVEVLDKPGTKVAFTVPSFCGGCASVHENYEPDAWSPDGRYLALSLWSDADPTKNAMALADRDNQVPWYWSETRTGNHLDIPVGFSPDGKRLLFMRTEEQNGPTSVGPLFVLKLSDLSVRQVTPRGITVSANGLTQGPASWSPDGGRIAYAGYFGDKNATAIAIVDATTLIEPFALVGDAPGATYARYSPDGSMIAFDRTAAGGFHDLYVSPVGGGEPRNLTADFSPGVCCAQWSPDGKALLALGTTSDDNHLNLFIVAADGSGIWQVTNDENVYTGFLWGPTFR